MRSARASRILLVLAAACLALLAILAVAVRLRATAVLDLDDDLGTPAESWSFAHPAAVRALIDIESAFGTIATVGYVAVLVLGLWWRGHRRAAGWTVLVVAGAAATTTALKLLLHRHRPVWTDPVHTLGSYSFPSGHASGIASAMGAVMVLASTFVAHRAVRRTFFVLAAGLILLVGADRVMLGVHNVSDVIAGYAVGGLWVLGGLALLPPRRGGSNQATERAPDSSV